MREGKRERECERGVKKSRKAAETNKEKGKRSYRKDNKKKKTRDRECVCVCERERERERERESVCVCVCVCASERKRDTFRESCYRDILFHASGLTYTQKKRRRNVLGLTNIFFEWLKDVYIKNLLP